MNNITKALFSEHIKGFKLQELFNYLGWNIERTPIQPFKVDDVVYSPKTIADKNGFKIIECRADSIPLYSIRTQILNLLKVKFAELMVIFTDNAKSRQVWLYAYKLGTQNKKAECEYRAGQDPQALYERASGLFFSLDEEDNITIIDVTARVRSNFTQNAERVTKRFYNEFKTQHTALLGFIKGITASVDREWYASIMLNRLMFCYFMEKRGFLNEDRHYLRNKLIESKEKFGTGKFYSFYRSFLLTLFQKGFGTFKHTPEIVAMIGKIPYLNGGLFDLHEIEQQYPDIDISDEAFERIFDLFDRYEWHLDIRECASGKEISPDVLGYIFEKYINDRAAMGAYYTQEDITGYISRSTILPYLFEATKKVYPAPFAQGGAVWKFLQGSGDLYIFDSVKRGADAVLPDNIALGLDTSAPNLIERRKDWNKPVPEGVGLPTEIWREFIERTTRYHSTVGKITSGEISDVSDFITYNLDIVSFVNDLLDSIEDPKFIQVFYAQLEKVTVLDPTCGSRAFLFAALNILEPLYDSCLKRMEDYLSHDYKGILERGIRRYFDEKLEQTENEIHPNKSYFIYKSIILNNLYGVDIMKEAVETAKLRLFLKLVSTAEPNYRAENIGIEPLPDIDFNIKSGNTLIGYANEIEVEDAIKYNLRGLYKSADVIDKMFQMSKATYRYKQLQLGEGDYRADDFAAAKVDLSARQAELRGNLDKLLRDNDYGNVSDDAWRDNYAPFHWISEFYSIIVDNCGFDVIIGNPPYVEYSKIKSKKYRIIGYDTETSGNLYAFICERALHLSKNNSGIGVIIPISSISSDRAMKFQNLLSKHTTWQYSYSNRPAKLFDGVEQRLTIFIVNNNNHSKSYNSSYNHWMSVEREALFDMQNYVVSTISDKPFAKIGIDIEASIFEKLHSHNKPLCNNIGFFTKGSVNCCYFHDAPTYWIRAMNFEPRGEYTSDSSNHYKEIACESIKEVSVVTSILNSSLFYFYFKVVSNCRDFSQREIRNFPVADAVLNEYFDLVANNLSENYKNNRLIKQRNYASGFIQYWEYYPQKSKPIADQIDTILAQHYGFTEEELDYIINYDIKYRMGLGGGDDDDGGDGE